MKKIFNRKLNRTEDEAILKDRTQIINFAEAVRKTIVDKKVSIVNPEWYEVAIIDNGKESMCINKLGNYFITNISDEFKIHLKDESTGKTQPVTLSLQNLILTGCSTHTIREDYVKNFIKN